jgi:murein tripeptide amidase MpaA
MTDNLQSWLDSGDLNTDSSASPTTSSFQSVLVPSFSLDRYHPLSNIYHYLQVISKLSRVKVFDIGTSHEGRSIKAVEIQNNPSDTNLIFIDGCTHAREWITVSTALFIIEHAIVSGIQQNFIIVPVINVDGYEYTWNTDRLWRKNRRPYSMSGSADRCNGVDLNRNYDINFLGEGSSSNPCSFLYGGPGLYLLYLFLGYLQICFIIYFFYLFSFFNTVMILKIYIR